MGEEVLFCHCHHHFLHLKTILIIDYVDIQFCIVDFLCMEHETRGRLLRTIESVADHGMTQAERGGGMETELMGASGQRVEGYQGAGSLSVYILYDLIAGEGSFAKLPIDHLTGTVIWIGADGEADGATERG